MASRLTEPQLEAGPAARTLPIAPKRPQTQLGSLPGRMATRGLDLGVSLAALLLTSPLMLGIAVLIKLDSPGPVLFRHRRVGQNRRRSGRHRPDRADERKIPAYGRSFTLLKFRTMYADARERFPEFYSYEYECDELHTLPIKVLVSTKQGVKGGHPDKNGVESLNDPRITRVGRWLRRSSLDELPNFLNVLRGEMHLVGPRPDIAENIQYYEPEHRTKLDVKPGITGLAQIQGRGNLSLYDTNAWDLVYVTNRSFWADLRIMLKTLSVSLKGHGAV